MQINLNEKTKIESINDWLIQMSGSYKQAVIFKTFVIGGNNDQIKNQKDVLKKLHKPN